MGEKKSVLVILVSKIIKLPISHALKSQTATKLFCQYEIGILSEDLSHWDA